MKKVALIMAMEAEAVQLIDKLGAHLSAINSAPLSVLLYSAAVLPNCDLLIALNGKDELNGVDNIATQAATLTTNFVLSAFAPDLVINAGTAGAFGAKGAEVGDIYIGNPELIFHDRRIPLPGFDTYGVGHYCTPDTASLARRLGAKTGIISTGNSLDLTDKDLEVMNNHGAAVKEMEAAAVGWVCSLYKTPLIVVKSITDLLDSPAATSEQFTENLTRVSGELSNFVYDLLKQIAEAKSMNELWSDSIKM